jgi:pyridoxine 4-dehydrogenase
MLTGEIKKPEDIPEGDFRRSIPRFSKENFPTNLELVQELEKFAKQKGCTPAQLAITWVKSLSKKDGNPEIIPIPGATTAERVTENSKNIALSSEEVAEIDSILKKFNVAGGRYGGHAVKFMEG